MALPAGWSQVEVEGKFSFWMPPGLQEAGGRGIDSTVRRWESPAMRVHFDYGRFSDPLTTYARKPGYRAAQEQIGGRPATLISYTQENGWRFTAAHFPDLGQDRHGQTLKLTLVVESVPQLGEEVPLTIIRSIAFQQAA